MTSEDRREARYRRRRLKREEKRQSALAKYGQYDKVFSFGNLYRAYKGARRNVGWKPSTKRFVAFAPGNVWKLYDELQRGVYKSDGFTEFDIHERGKARHIRAVKISERIVQKCLNRFCLTPLLSRSFIYDNGASLPGKGQCFTMERIKQKLRRHIRRCGPEGWTLTFDFKGYFDNLDHGVIFAILDRAIADERLRERCKYFVRCFGERGLGLGSEISQALALAAASSIDHLFCDRLGLPYVRYMDDGLAISTDRGKLQEAETLLRRTCERLRIRINPGKTVIRPLRDGFRFMKIRTRPQRSGKITQRLPENNLRLARTRIGKLRAYLDRGCISLADIWQSFQSWRSYALRFRAYRHIQDMKEFLIRVYPGIMQRRTA